MASPSLPLSHNRTWSGDYTDTVKKRIRRARAIQHAAMAVAHQPNRRHSDEENLYDLWRRAEEIRQYLEARAEQLVVVVAHGGILKVWLAHLMFTAVPG